MAPRANLDVVGNAFISGKIISDYLDHAAFANRTENDSDYALLVGGDSAAPENEATLRVATTSGGRVGINVTNAELDRALVVDGESRFTGDARFQEDIEVHGDGGANTAEIRTDITSGQFNFLMNSTFVGAANSSGLKVADKILKLVMRLLMSNMSKLALSLLTAISLLDPLQIHLSEMFLRLRLVEHIIIMNHSLTLRSKPSLSRLMVTSS